MCLNIYNPSAGRRNKDSHKHKGCKERDMLDMYNLIEYPCNSHLNKRIVWKGTTYTCKNQYNSNNSIYVQSFILT